MRYYTAGLAIVVIALGALVLFAAVRVAGHLSRQLSRPIDELVGWTRLIRQHEPLPEGPPIRGAPEFASLRLALRDMARTLDTARAQELEAERLRAFREVARRVAHEIKNPLTSMRIAVDQLQRTDAPSPGRTAMAIDVLSSETDRLERLARDFADFGRLPEGPTSEVDVVELLLELGHSAVPDSVVVRVTPNGGRRTIQGHYEPLRRAFSNLFRNAAEAMGGRGTIDVAVAGEGRGMVVTIADHGSGIPPELRSRVFEPYMTTKHDGTGLGLALVRQTVGAHHGTIAVSETPGGGATFTLVFPA
jgi:signal transduction histidine kinase